MGLALAIELIRQGTVQSRLRFDSAAERTIKIGRLESAQVRLVEPRAARIHAVITLTATRASVIDMGSAIGTLYNGARLSRAELRHGDALVIGDTTLRVGLEAAPAVIEPRFDGDVAAAAPPCVSRERLVKPAVASRPHPALPPEGAMTEENRVLELRYYWGEHLLGVYHYRKPKRLTIGETRHTDIFLSSEGLPTDEFPIVRYRDSEYLLSFSRRMEGEIDLGGELRSLRSLIGSSLVCEDEELEETLQIALPLHGRAVLHWGNASFAFRFVPPSAAMPRSVLASADFRYLNVLLVSICMHVACIVTLLVYPYDTVWEQQRDDLIHRAVVFEVTPPTASTQRMIDQLREKTKPPESEKVAVLDDKAALTVSVKPTESRSRRTAEQRSAELRRQISSAFGGGQGSILGGSTGGSLAGTLASVIGTRGPSSAGTGLFGFGMRGGPEIGGGVGRSRDVGGISTGGDLLGGGPGGYRPGLGDHRGVGLPETGTIQLGTPIPRELIQKIINENKAQVRWCYERRLQRQHDLQGRIALRWVIGANGAVARVAVTESTLGDQEVERCIAEKILSWKFPAPAGGGTVEVNYPFILSSSR